MSHESVLLKEAVAALCYKPAGVYVDGTFGRGGHSRAILAALDANSRLIGIDKDPEAIVAGEHLAEEDSRFSIVHTSFAEMEQIFDTMRPDGILLDLGVSSPQLDNPERGFSFTQDGPLDMRMNPQQGQSAAEWIATANEKEIADIFWKYGEERFSRRMARAIVNERKQQPIITTGHLAQLLKAAHPRWEKHKHPATRAFQAIRIFINKELDDLQKGLDAAVKLLNPGGRLVVISFHSLEDRIVKQFIKKQMHGDSQPLPRWVPVQQKQFERRLIGIGKQVKASEQEVIMNVRARSAIMRVAEKC